MYPHRIRLRGPWECEPLTRAVKQADGRMEMVPEALPPPCRMTLPCRWAEGGLQGFSGRVRFRRRFGTPRQLDPHELVWLTFAGIDDAAQVALNDRFLGRQEKAAEPFEFEVTRLLRERNELVVDVEGPASSGGLWGEVALEIRCGAFLRGIRARAELAEGNVRLRVNGEVVGTSDRPLELYLLLEGSTIAYRTIQPTTAGQSFAVVSDEIGLDRWEGLRRSCGDHPIRVDLVNGAIIWYTVECSPE
jgi:hypothetical protein